MYPICLDVCDRESIRTTTDQHNNLHRRNNRLGLTTPSTSTCTDGTTNYTCKGYYDLNGLIPGFSQSDVIYLSDGTAYRTWFIENVTGTDTITLNLWRGSYTFNIRTSPTICFWNETGAPVDTFEIDDAEYSFQRTLLQDQSGSPQWMFYKPILG